MTDELSEAEGLAETATGLRARTGSGLVWSGSLLALQVLLNVVAIAILSRLLAPWEYGVFAAALMFTDFSAMLAALGLNQALVQRKVLDRSHLSTAMSVSLALGVVLVTGLWLAAPTVASWLKIPELAGVLRILALFSFLQIFVARAEALLSRRLRFRQISLIKFGSWAAGTFLVTIPAAWAGMSYAALVAGVLTQLVLSAGLYGWFGRQDLAAPRFSPTAFRDLARKSIGFSGVEVLGYVSAYADNLAVGRGLGMAALAVYTRAYQLIQMPTGLVSNLSRAVLFPAMSQVQDEPHRMRAALVTGLGMTAAVTLPPSAFLAVYAPELVLLLLGPQWLAATGPFMAFACVIYMRIGHKIIGMTLQAKGLSFTAMFLQMIYAGLVVAGAVLAVQWGVGAVSIAVAGAIVASYVASLAAVARVLNIGGVDVLAIHLRALLAAGLVVLIGMSFRTWLSDAGAAYEVAVGAVACALLLGGAVWLRPSLLLGHDGAEMMVAMAGPLGRRIGWRAR